MSCRNWLPSPPIGVGIAVALLFALTALQNWQKPTQDSEQATTKNHQVATQRRAETDIPPISGIETPPSNPKPKRNEWRSESDLQAQWKAADWNEISAIASWVALAIAVLGVIYVKQTLDANVAAVKAAERTILVENRPWIKFTVEIGGDPISDSRGIFFHAG